MLAGAEGTLEEDGAQCFHSAFTHFGIALPLSALAQPRVVPDEGLESAAAWRLLPACTISPGKKASSLAALIAAKPGMDSTSTLV